MKKSFPFAPGVIDTAHHPRRKPSTLVLDFLGALALVVLAFFLAGWLL